MTTEQDTIGIAEDSNEDRKHQDDFLGPQARCLGSWLHSSFDGKNEWQVITSVGMATDVEKSPLVEEISRAGLPLNELVFHWRGKSGTLDRWAVSRALPVSKRETGRD